MRINAKPWGAELDLDNSWRSPRGWDLVTDDELVFLNLGLMRRLHSSGGQSAVGWRRLSMMIGRARRALACDGPDAAVFGSAALTRLFGGVRAAAGRPARNPGARLRPTAGTGEAGAPMEAALEQLGLAVLDLAALSLDGGVGRPGHAINSDWAASYGALLSFHGGFNAGYVLEGQEYHADLFAACAWLGIVHCGRPARVPAALASFMAWSGTALDDEAAQGQPDGWAVDPACEPLHALRIAVDASGLRGMFGAPAGPLPSVVWPTPHAGLTPASRDAAKRLLALFRTSARAGADAPMARPAAMAHAAIG